MPPLSLSNAIFAPLACTTAATTRVFMTNVDRFGQVSVTVRVYLVMCLLDLSSEVTEVAVRLN